MSQDNHSPDMSVVLVEPTDYAAIRQTVQHLCRQTIRDRLEIVFVVDAASSFDLPANLITEFCRVQVVRVGTIASLALARAEGIRAATAPIVVLGENHSFPEPDWAEALVQAHQQAFAAVGPVVNIANPGSHVARAMHLITYGAWNELRAPRVVDDLPGHNSSYKRAILLGLGAELETLLQAESVLHWELQRQGYQLYIEPAAKTQHHSSARLSTILPELYNYGRVFADTRALKWRPILRFAYGASTPLIPFVRLARIVGQMRRSRSEKWPGLEIFGTIVLGLIVSAAGEGMGYLFGAGNSMRELSRFELEHFARESRTT